MRKTLLLLAAFSMFTACGALFAQQNKLVNFDDIYSREVLSAGFELTGRETIKIDTKFYYESKRDLEALLGNAWILNSNTRNVVWELSKSDFEKDRGFVRIETEIELNPGIYEVYHSSFLNLYHEGKSFSSNDNWDGYEWNGLKDLFGRINRSRGWRVDEDSETILEDIHFSIAGQGRELTRSEMKQIQKGQRKDALILFNPLRDARREVQAFTVKKATDVKIYATGEANRDGNYDYGVILNTDTFEPVWELTYRHSKHAGGSRKNRVAEETLNLEAGDYIAIYVTDDSHSPREWNQAPPYDPAFWGMAINPANSSDRGNIKLEEHSGFILKNTIVDFTKLRDEEFRSQGFTLKRKMKLHVIATGEGRKGDMFDYGWIVDAKTRKKVWEMNYDETEPAGGDKKNRKSDSVVTLSKGSYIAYFVTDDSHSYQDWNTSPPVLEEFWGMAILPAEKNYRASDIDDYKPEEQADTLVRITRVRDHNRERQNFTLKKKGKVRIYALGEGMRGDMFDYGWIENTKTGDVVWEMSFRRTDHAGGADKNRMIDNIIELDKGDYIVYYESDDSHSFGDWNAAPPYDPESWGITVFLAKN